MIKYYDKPYALADCVQSPQHSRTKIQPRSAMQETDKKMNDIKLMVAMELFDKPTWSMERSNSCKL